MKGQRLLLCLLLLSYFYLKEVQMTNVLTVLGDSNHGCASANEKSRR